MAKEKMMYSSNITSCWTKKSSPKMFDEETFLQINRSRYTQIIEYVTPRRKGNASNSLCLQARR